MGSVSAPKDYRAFYLGKGSVIHGARDSDTRTLCKKPLTTVKLAHTSYLNCTACAKAALALSDALSTNGEKDTMPPKKKTAETKPAQDSTPDVDGLISNVHATIDALKAVDPTSDDAATQADNLKTDAESQIRHLPTNKRTALRKAVSDAHKAATTKPEPAAPSAEVAVVSDDPMKWDNLPQLITHAAKKMREGVDAGLKLTSAGEEVANVLLTIRQNIIDPETGLPDLPWRMKVTRNAAGKVYSDALEGVSEDAVEWRESHAALQKATQNKASDVLVSWLRGYNREDAKSLEMLGELYPGAVELLEKDPELEPEAAIRALYAEKGVELPTRGRTEQMRLTRRVEKIQRTAKELEAAQDAGNTAKAEELTGAINDLKADLPDDMLEKLGETETEKTDAEKTTEALERAWKALETAGKRAKKVKNSAQKRKIKAQMYEKIRALAEDFDLDLSALVPAEEESGE